MEIDIPTYLQQFRNRPVCYFPNPGNAGDAIITMGTHHAFRHAGLDYTSPQIQGFSPAGKTIFYGGGGNLVHETRHSYRTISALHAEAGHLVILPHTIRDVDRLLAAFGRNVTVICRELRTYDYVRRTAAGCEVLLGHDMALFLDVRALLAMSFPTPRLTILMSVLKARLARQSHLMREPLLELLRGTAVARVDRLASPDRRLTCIRTDDESTNLAAPPDNIDLPRVLALGNSPYEVVAYIAHVFARTIDRFDEVVTNRLHVGITAGLLGKQVKFYPNNYYKNQAVYEYTVKDRFPNVTWMG